MLVSTAAASASQPASQTWHLPDKHQICWVSVGGFALELRVPVLKVSCCAMALAEPLKS